MKNYWTERYGRKGQADDTPAFFHLGYYDAVLMDIHMPRMEGLEAAKVIRTVSRPESRMLPILAMTANAFGGDTKKIFEYGDERTSFQANIIEKIWEMLYQCMNSKRQSREGGESIL